MSPLKCVKPSDTLTHECVRIHNTFNQEFSETNLNGLDFLTSWSYTCRLVDSFSHTEPNFLHIWSRRLCKIERKVQFLSSEDKLWVAMSISKNTKRPHALQTKTQARFHFNPQLQFIFPALWSPAQHQSFHNMFFNNNRPYTRMKDLESEETLTAIDTPSTNSLPPKIANSNNNLQPSSKMEAQTKSQPWTLLNVTLEIRHRIFDLLLNTESTIFIMPPRSSRLLLYEVRNNACAIWIVGSRMLCISMREHRTKGCKQPVT